MSRYQRGHVYEAFSAFHVQYYHTELRDGQQIRVRRSQRPCAKDRVHYPATSKAVQKLCADFMSTVNEDVVVGEDMPITDFWTKYLHYCEHEYKGRGMKPSTVRGFKQLWNYLESVLRGTLRQTHAPGVPSGSRARLPCEPQDETGEVAR
jgi:hypothetical protein